MNDLVKHQKNTLWIRPFPFFLILFLLLSCFPQTLLPTEAASSKNGWVKQNKKTFYYKKGLPVSGVQKISGNYYYFDAYGVLQTKSTKKDGRRYLIGDENILEAIRYKGSYYYANGKQMTSADTTDYTTLLRARSVVAKITKDSMSDSQKLYACFKYTMHFPYKTQRKFSPTADWTAVNANDHFVRGAGDCHADACSFAYLCAALGKKNVYACNDAKGTHGEGHSWTEVNGKVYDALFAEAKSFDKYYGVSYGHPILHVKVPYYSPSHASKSGTALTSSKDGLIKKSGSYYFFKNGSAVSKKWLRIGGKKYYFTSSGKAATGAYAVKQTYYIFSKDGVLFEPKKIKKVSVLGRSYRVRPSGKAYHGWYQGKTFYFSEKGEKLTGIQVISGKFFAFSKSGAYQKEKTLSIRKAAIIGKDAKPLLELLGHPKSQSTSPNCDIGEGDDVLYDYGNFAIKTYIPPVNEEGEQTEVYQGIV